MGINKSRLSPRRVDRLASPARRHWCCAGRLGAGPQPRQPGRREPRHSHGLWRRSNEPVSAGRPRKSVLPERHGFLFKWLSNHNSDIAGQSIFSVLPGKSDP
jgi:hypothetical protein